MVKLKQKSKIILKFLNFYLINFIEEPHPFSKLNTVNHTRTLFTHQISAD